VKCDQCNEDARVRIVRQVDGHRETSESHLCTAHAALLNIRFDSDGADWLIESDGPPGALTFARLL
jgi:hypothetical protein